MKSNTVLIKVEGGIATALWYPDHITILLRNYDDDNEQKISNAKIKTTTKQRFTSCYTQLIEEGRLVLAEFKRAMLKAFPLYWDENFRNSCTDMDDLVIRGTQCLWLITSDGLELVHSDGEQIKLDCLEMDEIVDFADSLILDWDELLKELKKHGNKIKSGVTNKA